MGQKKDKKKDQKVDELAAVLGITNFRDFPTTYDLQQKKTKLTKLTDRKVKIIEVGYAKEVVDMNVGLNIKPVTKRQQEMRTISENNKFVRLKHGKSVKKEFLENAHLEEMKYESDIVSDDAYGDDHAKKDKDGSLS